jgi:hypothetical protein
MLQTNLTVHINFCTQLSSVTVRVASVAHGPSIRRDPENSSGVTWCVRGSGVRWEDRLRAQRVTRLWEGKHIPTIYLWNNSNAACTICTTSRVTFKSQAKDLQMSPRTDFILHWSTRQESESPHWFKPKWEFIDSCKWIWSAERQVFSIVCFQALYNVIRTLSISKEDWW